MAKSSKTTVVKNAAEQLKSAQAPQKGGVSDWHNPASQQLVDEVEILKQREANLTKKVAGLQKQIKEEQELGDLKTRFITLASHEFRTPLSTIMSSAGLAGQYAETGNIEKTSQHLEKIRVSAMRMTDILHDFLQVNRIEEGRVKLVLEKFDLVSLVEESIERVKQLERPNLVIDFETDRPVILVQSDREILLAVAQTLLVNAARFSKKAVRCRAGEIGNRAFFEVRDEGVGIPETEQEHIFERFFRASNVSNVMGIGLGLHISQQYLHLLDGEIKFESKEGKGTTFSMNFPIKTIKT